MLRRLALPTSRRQSLQHDQHIVSLAANASSVRQAHHARFTPNAAKKRRAARPLAAWKIREKELRSELTFLESQADELQKRNKAKEATKDLPELDEASLDEIYQGVKAGDPVPPEELKLLESHQRKSTERYARIVQNARKLLPASAQQQESLPPRTFAERMKERLMALSARLETMQQQALVEGAPSSSAATGALAQWKDRTGQLKQSLEALTAEAESPEGEEAAGTGEMEDDQYRHFETVGLRSVARAPDGEDQSGSSEVAQSNAPQEQLTSTEELVGKLVTFLEAAEGSSSERHAIVSTIHQKDWVALGLACAEQRDAELLRRTLEAIEQLAAEELISRDSLDAFYNSVADAFAEQGDSTTCEAIVQHLVSSGRAPTSFTHHALVKAYLRSPNDRLSQALSLIHHLELTPTPPSQATYSMTISHLLSSSSEELRDEVWGVWYRMRLNAHPVPDAVVWGNMLRACALGTSPGRDSAPEHLEQHRSSKKVPTMRELRRQDASVSQRETALDLFREMTVVHGIRPTPVCYNNLILACCRSADEGAYLDGFRLLSEMITLGQETGISSYEPDRATFYALLEGCRRGKDVLRARWVLAEMIRSSAPLWSSPASSEALTWEERARLEARMPDAKILSQLFYTYTGWRPTPVAVKAKTAEKVRSAQGTRKATSADVQDSDSSNQALSQVDLDEAASEFSSRPPATSTEVVREVRGLLARVIADRVSPGMLPIGPMSSVEISTRLLNAYLAVLKTHAPRSECAAYLGSAVRSDQTQDPPRPSLFEQLGLTPCGHTWLHVMEACTRSGKSPYTRSLGDWAWTQWRSMEDEALAHGSVSESMGTDKRNRERIWAERIRFLCTWGQLDEAMATLRDFARLYPPMPKPAPLPKARRKMPFFDFKAVLETIERAQYASGKGQSLLEARPEQPQLTSQASEAEEVATPSAAGSSTSISESDSASTSASTTTPSTTSPPRWSSSHRDRPPSLKFYDLNLLHQRLLEAGDRSADGLGKYTVCWLEEKVC
ncbi:hypothetical protein BCV69DRAFT_292762 [Microstroma glucosiphilum]|uniref:Pentacotripeptide-repeat region of PRORP domain-containing protein n=1 Tax=Pseudomicrostroma glucosiphilum TaxID=1684307 RepID=A0A316UD03_9BASI|nr:hypothetical protein BCV69DRAFT_292762 [Pseudomicrostroma glucosiphilum]PWN22253.1 hypothetical protein BCV69DRAFT_292762 [Pseudomicrostroma glucosiphilum]